jgi:hypothetical protein
MTQHISRHTGIRPGTYLIDPARSTIEFTGTHVFGLKPVKGTMTVRSGTVVVAADERRSTVSAEIDAASWTSDDERRNRDVRGKRFLNVEAHPVVAFRSTGVVAGAAGHRSPSTCSTPHRPRTATASLPRPASTVPPWEWVPAGRSSAAGWT